MLRKVSWGGTGTMRSGGARKGFGVARKHRWNVDIQSQNARISGKGKSVSYDTHLLTYCLNYGLLSSTPSAEHQECKDKQPPTLMMLQASGNELLEHI